MEDGSGVAGAESYASVARFIGYRSVSGLSIPTETREENLEWALIGGTAYLNFRYAWLWPGRRWSREQGLAWPRAGACDKEGVALVGLPLGVVHAAMEAALVDLNQPGILWDSLNGNGTVRAESEGGVRKEYERGIPGLRSFPAIHAQVAGFLVAESGIRVERG